MTPEPLMTDAVARLRRFAAERAGETLLRTRGRCYTYADMETRATRVAAALLAAAGRRGARVALVLEEYDQFFVCMLGAWLAGLEPLRENSDGRSCCQGGAARRQARSDYRYRQ